MEPKTETIIRNVLETCSDCEGTGLKDMHDNLDVPCGFCGGKGKVSRPQAITRPIALVSLPAPAPAAASPLSVGAPSTLSLTLSPNSVLAPIQAATHVVFHNPNETIQLIPLATVPLGQLWLVGPAGGFTKIGEKT